MDLQQILRGVDLFEGLTDQELERVVKICNERRFSPGEMITKEGAEGNELFIITEGFVEIVLGERSTIAARVVVSLGPGQITSERIWKRCSSRRRAWAILSCAIWLQISHSKCATGTWVNGRQVRHGDL